MEHAVRLNTDLLDLIFSQQWVWRDTIIWVLAWYRLLEAHRCFRGIYHLYLQGHRVCQARNQLCLLPLHAGFFACLLCNPEDGGGIFLCNISGLLPDYVVLEPRMSYFSYTNLLHQLERNVPFGPQHENYDSGFYSGSLLMCILLLSLCTLWMCASVFRVGLKSWR
jgi:hypothetical protein